MIVYQRHVLKTELQKKKRCVKYSPKVQTELQKIELTLSNIHPKFNTQYKNIRKICKTLGLFLQFPLVIMLVYLLFWEITKIS